MSLYAMAEAEFEGLSLDLIQYRLVRQSRAIIFGRLSVKAGLITPTSKCVTIIYSDAFETIMTI